MGYGSRAIDLLISYFQGQLGTPGNSPPPGMFGGEGVGDHLTTKQRKDEHDGDNLLEENVETRKKVPSLLSPLVDRPPERLHWLGVSYGLTSQLLQFWSRKGFKVCYLRQTRNELTGEHSSIMLRECSREESEDDDEVGFKRLTAAWLEGYVLDYRKRLISLMSYSFRSLESVLAITLIDPDRTLTSTTSADHDSNHNPNHYQDHNRPTAVTVLTASELLSVHLSYHDLHRLELYSRNMVDHHMILDMVPTLSRLLFAGRFHNIRFSYLQVVILLAIGLQHRDVDDIALEMDIPVGQVLAFFNKTIRRLVTHLKELVETNIAKDLPTIHDLKTKSDAMTSLTTSLSADQQHDAEEFTQQQLMKQSKRTETSTEINDSMEITSTEKPVSEKLIRKHGIKSNPDELTAAFQKGLKRRESVPHLISATVNTDGNVMKSNEVNNSIDIKTKKMKKRFSESNVSKKRKEK
jgi:N-acetyltransferase 10